MKKDKKTQKNLGIWMDHSTANLIDLKSKKRSYSISLDRTSNINDDGLIKSERGIHNRKQELQEAYYKEIAEVILKYNHVLLFGPTDAKMTLFNYLINDFHFKDIKIDVEVVDKMTENQQVAFVKNFFE
ncbi:hypothetical protein K8354_18225 [Polaribacter litorisediminis]|uniref:hypothetical protein n=1 Tax=Polaribacter litorisediminis TaxID=1908341 RepID=UPI001CBBBB5D|nr:hypothetical protein [Polaribacter litorisediminis]UAM98186.1 hypothetical protein K8354_18225 [Polaribacter litorisediminis]